jgi:hypothetical protein
MNSRYPTHEFRTTTLFKVLRESNDSFQLASQVQFHDVPTSAKKCALLLVFPGPNSTDISGLSPSFNVYQVERAPGAPTSWASSIFAQRHIDVAAGNANITGAAPTVALGEAVGTMNGDPDAVRRVRDAGSRVVVGYMECNETLTFQMGMARPGMGPLVNYWDFVDVAPGATPSQGWRVVYRPEEC